MDKVQHFQFAADNPQRASKFYAGVFGWKIEEMDNAGEPYWSITTGSVGEDYRGNEVNSIGGGMDKRRSPKESTTIFVTVTSIEDTLAKVESNGGKIIQEKTPMGPDKENPYGYIGILEDTEGNNIGLWADK